MGFIRRDYLNRYWRLADVFEWPLDLALCGGHRCVGIVGADISQADNVGLPAASCFGAAWLAIERRFQLPQKRVEGGRSIVASSTRVSRLQREHFTSRAVKPLPIAIAMVGEGCAGPPENIAACHASLIDTEVSTIAVSGIGFPSQRAAQIRNAKERPGNPMRRGRSQSRCPSGSLLFPPR